MMTLTGLREMLHQGKTFTENGMADTRITEVAKERLDSIFESYSIIADDLDVFVCDMQFNYSRWAKELVDTFGLPSEYMYDAGLIWEEHIHPDDRAEYRKGIDAIFLGSQPTHDMQYRARRPDGEYDVCTCRGIVILDGYGKPAYFAGAIRNHSKLSYIDSITGLRNQYAFFSDLKSYIKKKIPVRIGMAGIGKLAEINAVYGYDAGNQMLQHFGRYLMDNVTSREGTYRLDGSRFAIISETRTEQELIDLYELLRSFFRKGVRLDDNVFVLECNAGLLSLNDFNIDDQTVYACLNLAYQESKLIRHGDLVTFRTDLTADSKKNSEKLYAIHSSISQGFEGFYLLYQPVVDASTERVIGAEALLRWKNEEYGVVPPDVFISFLEGDPLFPELGKWILNTAIEDAKKITEYVPDFVINVNLSYVQLEKGNFPEIVREAIKKNGFSADQVCLEMTERCRLLDMELLRNVIATLHSGGVKVALDDFGTGFSSIGLMKNLPFNTIKIDKSFVQQIEKDEREKRLLCNFTDMAGIFGADVCVEGIETPGMRDIIKDYGIHSFQGYFYSKPIAIDELLNMVKSGSDCFARQ